MAEKKAGEANGNTAMAGESYVTGYAAYRLLKKIRGHLNKEHKLDAAARNRR